MGATEILYAAITLAGVIITALISRDSFSKELDKKVAVLEERMNNMLKELSEHNHYAKLYSETMPEVKANIKELQKSLDKMEKGATK